jgi:hypothetical protein
MVGSMGDKSQCAQGSRRADLFVTEGIINGCYTDWLHVKKMNLLMMSVFIL